MTTKRFNKLLKKLQYGEPISNDGDYTPFLPTDRQIYNTYKAGRIVEKINKKLKKDVK